MGYVVGCLRIVNVRVFENSVGLSPEAASEGTYLPKDAASLKPVRAKDNPDWSGLSPFLKLAKAVLACHSPELIQYANWIQSVGAVPNVFKDS